MYLMRASQLAWFLSVFPIAQCDFLEETPKVKQVAIIGAGAAGSSTAYHLRKYAAQDGVADVNITIFEKTNHIGGRTLTVDVYDDPLNPVELGASIFVEVNYILYNATRDFNLPLTDPGTDENGLLGVWDGENFVYTQDSESWGWWNLAKLFWKYGSAPYYTHRLVQDTVGTFLKLYQAPYFPFRSLSTRAFELGLVRVTGLTGQQFLAENKLDGPFAHDIVQASTRVNYASNLQYIHGLGTMVAMAPEGAVAVAGGNWQIFSKMVADSQAHVSLNTTVTAITKESSPGSESKSPKYQIKTKATGSTADEDETYPVTFDKVVIAAPYQFSGISHDDDVIAHPVDSIPYVTLHVTLFASPYRFSPEFFGLEPTSKVPISVLTTLGEDEEAKPGSEGAGNAGFFSATLVKVVTNSKTNNTEYVYKIFSPDKVTPEFLSRLLGVQIPETFTRSDPSTEGKDTNANEKTVVDPISWYHPTVFHPYPQKFPRVTFQDPILGDGLYYTSGIESFISTMETSALMGMNVARLIADENIRDYMRDELGIPIVDDKDQETEDPRIRLKEARPQNCNRPFDPIDEL
ncbi:prenylcysteine oxidase [Hypoxylon trugodes]|uniref:prenylcysteine oxidase n=1 Tax=Hypoxylon trugodes TaxID=326681 RepID=UPI002198CF83|nr:prenylcysteine oxidase [Hypoxylon trugodes]KAI1385691.1 prenylcysteine oxidase [Hypoxylon trugodes]